MESIRTAIRHLPPGAVIRILRKVFAYPAPTARLILNDIARPRKSQEQWIRKVKGKDGWTGCWIGDNVRGLDDAALRTRIDQADLILFNVHGGGFRLGMPTMYMGTYKRWIKYCKHKHHLDVLIMSVDYRLAPEHKYPSAMADVMKAYEYALDKLKIAPSKIIMTGDSAGATLILEMLFITHDPSMFEIETDSTIPPNTSLISELPRPAGLVLISPLLTGETDSPSWKTNLKHDYISLNTAKIIKKEYFDHSAKDDNDGQGQSYPTLGIISLQTEYQAFLPPKVLVFVGDKEVMRDDIIDFTDKASSAGVHFTTVLEDCVHNWACLPEVVKDRDISQRSYDAFADFCQGALEHARHSLKSTQASSFAHDVAGLVTVSEADENYNMSDDDEFYGEFSLDTHELEAVVLQRLDEQAPPSSIATAKSSI